jgi:glycosyltransferase involved in cell wall biosynthesis
MQIDHITFSKSGGAGVVAAQLQSSQRSAGIDSLLFTSLETDLFREPIKHPFTTAGALVDRHIVSSNFRPTPVSVFRSAFAPNERRVRDGSIIHLHWVEGVLPHKQIQDWVAQGRRVVWTLHDMAPFTGGCHHSFDCEGYLSACSECPQVKPFFRHRVKLNLQAKISRSTFENLSLVAPTAWLAKRALSSAVFRHSKVSIIPNPISEDFFHEFDRRASRQKLGIPLKSAVGVIIATNLSDSNKRVREVVDVFARIALEYPERELRLILVGSKGEKFVELAPKLIVFLGPLQTPEIAFAAAAADFAVSFSRVESAGLTISECGALGVPTIASNSGGSVEMFTPGESGYLVESQRHLEHVIEKIVSGELGLKPMGAQARSQSMKFHPDKVSKEYQKLYNTILR